MHPNVVFIKRRAPYWRTIRRWLVVSTVGTYFGLQVLRASQLITVDASNPHTPWIINMLIVYALTGVLVVAIVEFARRIGHARPWRRWTTPPMQTWARIRGHSCVRRPDVQFHFPVLGEPARQRIDTLATIRLDTGEEVQAFEARYYCNISGIVGHTRFMTAVLLPLDQAWTTDLPQVTVSPSWEYHVDAAQDIHDRRWELGTLDHRFQVDAAARSGESEVALTRLFGPQLQLALGSTFCAYWQQSSHQLLVWVPGRSISITRMQALFADALWLRERYAELGSWSHRQQSSA